MDLADKSDTKGEPSGSEAGSKRPSALSKRRGSIRKKKFKNSSKQMRSSEAFGFTSSLSLLKGLRETTPGDEPPSRRDGQSSQEPGSSPRAGGMTRKAKSLRKKGKSNVHKNSDEGEQQLKPERLTTFKGGDTEDKGSGSSSPRISNRNRGMDRSSSKSGLSGKRKETKEVFSIQRNQTIKSPIHHKRGNTFKQQSTPKVKALKSATPSKLGMSGFKRSNNIIYNKDKHYNEKDKSNSMSKEFSKEVSRQLSKASRVSRESHDESKVQAKLREVVQGSAPV
jgi:hypothetical protein